MSKVSIMRLSIFFTLLSLIFSNLSLAAPFKVLFDEGHGQAFTVENEGDLQLGQLAGKLGVDGWQVIATRDSLTPQLLNEAKALVISGAFKPFSENEISAISGFLNNGGRLVVLLHIAQPLVPLLSKLGVAVGNGVVREWDKSLIIDRNPLYFKVSNLKDHPLNKGLKYFSLYGGWPLLPLQENISTIASTSPMAWIDVNRDQNLSSKEPVQEFGVLVTGSVGLGGFAVFADDAIFQNRFLKGENEKLLKNLSDWMREGKS
jgi:hypothetical protein